ncbi:O-antigen ligase family protein [Sphingobium aromaticiconvertens]|uniref:O-antigen ligase family protein n=1 Tax=Sphingobium aromaticiconvertens TaxID=365341 RepID=UPI003019E4BF
MSSDPDKLELFFAQEPSGTADLGAYQNPVYHGRSFWLTIATTLLTLAVFFTGYHELRLSFINLTLADICFLVALVAFLSHGMINTVPFGLMTPLWLAALSLMLGGLFFSSLVYGDLSRWIVIALQYLVAFFFIPIVLTAQSRATVQRLALIFVMGATTMEAIGALVTLLFTHNTAPGILGAEFLTGNGRLGAFAGEANWNGMLISAAFTMLYYCLRERLAPRWMLVIAGCILAWGLLLTASFTGFMATTVVTAFTLLLLGGRYLMRGVIAIAVGIAIFVASGAPLPATFSKRVGGAIASGDISQAGTFLGRVELIKEAWSIAEDTTLLGVGADEFRNVSVMQQPVHNLYLLIYTEGGLPAFMGLLGLLGLMLGMALQGIRIRRSEGVLALTVICVFLIYTTSSPHMYARFFLMPSMLALSLLFVRDDPQPGVAHPSLLARH